MGRSVEREEMGQRGKGYETLFTMIGAWALGGAKGRVSKSFKLLTQPRGRFQKNRPDCRVKDELEEEGPNLRGVFLEKLLPSSKRQRVEA